MEGRKFADLDKGREREQRQRQDRKLLAQHRENTARTRQLVQATTNRQRAASEERAAYEASDAVFNERKKHNEALQAWVQSSIQEAAAYQRAEDERILSKVGHSARHG